MKKVLLLFTFIILGCTEDVTVVSSNIYPEDPFFTLDPYPLIQINSADPVVGTFRPGYPSNQIRVTGFKTDNPSQIDFTINILDTLSSADVVPGDNVYRFFLSRSLFPISSDFTIVVQAYQDDNQVWNDSLSNIETLANASPLITELVLADSLTPDTLTWSWEITVFDPDPGEEIEVETYAEYPNGWVYIGTWLDDGSADDMVAGDGVIQAVFDSTSRMGLMGDANLKFLAIDQTNNTDELIKKINVINNPPVINELSIPDSMIIRSLQSETLFSIRVSDTETRADIDSVIALFYDASGGFKVKADQFNDDGLNGDVIANDGWFSVKVISPTDPESAGLWTLKIYSRDKAKNKSDVILHQLLLRNE